MLKNKNYDYKGTNLSNENHEQIGKNSMLQDTSSMQYVQSIKHLLISIILTTLIYLIIYTWIEVSFFNKFIGWPQFVSVLFFFWSLSIILSKSIEISKNINEQKHFFFNYENNSDLSDPNVLLEQKCIKIKEECLIDNQTKFGEKIINLLDYGLMSKKIDEVRNYLIDENNNDYDELESSYSLIRVMLWTMPIIGFIGTVLGVGQAVGGFAQFLSAAQEIDQIKVALKGVTSGLGVAFDSTLIALLLSVLVMIFMSAVEQFEIKNLRHSFQNIQSIVYDMFGNIKPSSIENESGMQPFSHKKIDELLLEFKNIPIDQNKLIKIVKFWQSQMNKTVKLFVKDWELNCNKVIKNIHSTYEKNEILFKNNQKIVTNIIQEGNDLRSTSKEVLHSINQLVQKEKDSLKEIFKIESHAIKELTLKQREQTQEYISTFADVQEMMKKLVDLEIKIKDELKTIKEYDSMTSVMNKLTEVLNNLDPAIKKIVEKPIDVNVQFSTQSA